MFGYFFNKTKSNQIWNIFKILPSPYHLVPASGYPIILASSLLLTVITIFNIINVSELFYFKDGVPFINKVLFSIYFFSLIISLILWLIQVLNEGFSGEHTKFVMNGLKLGFLLFICSEIMLFFAVFWGWFHINLFNEFAGFEKRSCNYLPKIDWYPLPALGTLILGSSSAFLTESHMLVNWQIFSSNIKNLYSFFKKIYINCSNRLLRMTCGFGALFLLLQSVEYNFMGYSWRGHAYASLFYIITSLHGFHVFIGLLFLLTCYMRLSFFLFYLNFFKRFIHFRINLKFFTIWILNIDYLIYIYNLYIKSFFLQIKFSEERHIFFEVSAWYWHFVDVVWLFVFLYVYFWLNGYGHVIPESNLNDIVEVELVESPIIFGDKSIILKTQS